MEGPTKKRKIVKGDDAKYGHFKQFHYWIYRKNSLLIPLPDYKIRDHIRQWDVHCVAQP